MREPTIRERVMQNVTPEEYNAIRKMWMKHSQAEDRREIEGLISTLTDDCVYEILPTGQRWEGHDSARNFYTSFLGAFPDIHFDLTDIVIGPQGAFEVAMMTGTHRGIWAGIEPTGKSVTMRIMIYFPWDTGKMKFTGEKIYFDRMDLLTHQ